jgi:hypothetical protein
MHTSYSIYILHSLVDSTLWLLGLNTLLDHLRREVGVWGTHLSRPTL